MGRYISPIQLRDLVPGPWIEEYLTTEPVYEQGTERIIGYVPATDAQVETFISSAENEADSYLGVAYALPLPSVPEMLRQVVADICRYRIAADRPTEAIRVRYEDALAWLARVAKGTASLGVQAQAPQPTTSPKAISRPGTYNLTRDKLRAWGL